MYKKDQRNISASHSWTNTLLFLKQSTSVCYLSIPKINKKFTLSQTSDPKRRRLLFKEAGQSWKEDSCLFPML